MLAPIHRSIFVFLTLAVSSCTAVPVFSSDDVGAVGETTEQSSALELLQTTASLPFDAGSLTVGGDAVVLTKVVDDVTQTVTYLPAALRSGKALPELFKSLGITLVNEKLNNANLAGFNITVKREGKGSLITLFATLDKPMSVKDLFSIITSKPGTSVDSDTAYALERSGFSMPAIPSEMSSSPIVVLRFTLTSDLSRISTVSLKAALPVQLTSKYVSNKVANQIALGEMIWTFENPFTSGVSMRLMAQAEWRLSSAVAFAVQVDLSAADDGLAGRISGGLAFGDVAIGQLSEAFGTGSASWLGSLKQMKVGNIRVDCEWANKNSFLDWVSLKVTGTTGISGTIGQIELITGSMDSFSDDLFLVVSATVATPKAAASLLGQTVPGMNSSYLANFPPMTTRIVFSTRQIEPASNPKFVPNENRASGTIVREGVSLELAYLTPDTCDGVDLAWFCQASLKTIGKGSYLKLGGYLDSKNWLMGLEAQVANVQFTTSVTLMQAAIFVQLGPKEISMGLRGRLQYTTDDGSKLEYYGALQFGIINALPTLKLSFSQTGMWERVFGLEPVALGNMDLGGTAKIAPLMVTAFHVGGQIYIGNNCLVARSDGVRVPMLPSKCIGGAAYVGVDLEDPSGNYFSLTTSELSLGQIVSALAPPEWADLLDYMPDCIKETGFPKGLNISFASKQIVLNNGITIKSGFNFQGIFRFLGYNIDAQIAWVFKSSLKMRIIFDKLDWTVLKISDRLGSSKGPEFLLDVNYKSLSRAAMSPLRLYASAAVEVLGMGVGAQLEISLGYFRLELEGQIFGGSFSVKVKILATLGLGVSLTGSAARFEFAVSMVSQSLDQVKVGINDKCKKGVEDGHSALDIMIAQTQEAITNLTLSTRESKQCWSACGETENCLAAFEQCKDPYYNTDVVRTCTTNKVEECAETQVEDVCTKWGLWGFGWWCSTSVKQCCTRQLTDEAKVTCQSKYDNCLTGGSLTPWKTFFTKTFTGNFGGAWCSMGCLAKDLDVKTHIWALQLKILGLQTLKAISRGAELLWTTLKKLGSFLLSINNITAAGVLSPSYSSFDFAVDMSILSIPIKGSFTIGTKPGSQPDYDALAASTVDAARDTLADPNKRSSLPVELLQLYDGTWAVEDKDPAIEEQLRLSLCAYQYGTNVLLDTGKKGAQLTNNGDIVQNCKTSSITSADASRILAKDQNDLPDPEKLANQPEAVSRDRLVLTFSGNISDFGTDQKIDLANQIASLLNITVAQVKIEVADVSVPEFALKPSAADLSAKNFNNFTGGNPKPKPDIAECVIGMYKNKNYDDLLIEYTVKSLEGQRIPEKGPLVTAVGDNTLSVKLSPGCKTVVLVDDDGEADYDKAEKWTLTDSTPLVEYDFQNDIQFMRAWSRDASCCMAGTSCLKCANGMEVVAPEVCDTKRRCRLEPLAPHIGPQFVARAIILADVSFDTLSEVAKQLGATSSSATKLAFSAFDPAVGLAANKCPAYAKAVDSAVLCKAAANALGFEYRDQNRSDLPKGCGRLVAGATNVFWNDHPVGQASATYAFVCSTGAYSAGPAGAGSCATGLRAVDSALQCESAAAQLGYRWQSNSLMKDATRPLGCSAIPTTDNSNAAFWNVGINAKGAPASNASPICLPATAAPSQSELIVGFVLAKADLKKSATPSTKQMIIKVGGTQPSAGLTEGIRNKLATHLEVDPSRVVADVKATSKETVITVSLRTDPFADANATVRPNAQLLALGKMTPQALATLLDRTPLGRTCTVSLYRDEDFVRLLATYTTTNTVGEGERFPPKGVFPDSIALDVSSISLSAGCKKVYVVRYGYAIDPKYSFADSKKQVLTENCSLLENWNVRDYAGYIYVASKVATSLNDVELLQLKEDQITSVQAVDIPEQVPAPVTVFEEKKDKIDWADWDTWPFILKGSIEIGGENLGVRIDFDSSTGLTSIIGHAKAGGIADLLKAVNIPAGDSFKDWEVTHFTISLRGKKLIGISAEVNKSPQQAMSEVGDANMVATSSNLTNDDGWMKVQKLNASIEFANGAQTNLQSISKISMFVAVAKEGAKVSENLQFQQATMAASVTDPFNKTKMTWMVELTGLLTLGSANIQGRFFHDSATNVTELNAAVTGMGFISVLRNIVPLAKAPSQLEKLELSSFKLKFLGRRITSINCELNQIAAATAIETVGGADAIASAQTAPAGKMDWLQLKKVILQANFDPKAVNFTITDIHIFTALAGTEPLAPTPEITFKDATVDVGVWNPLDSKTRVINTELTGSWALGGALLRARVKYNSQTKQLEIDTSAQGQGLLSVLRNVVPLAQAPKQFEALELTSFSLMVVDKRVVQIKCELNALPSAVMDTVGGSGAAEQVAAATQGGSSWLQLKRVAATILIDYSAGAKLSALELNVKMAKDATQTVTPQVMLTGIELNCVFSELLTEKPPWTVKVTGDWVLADNTVQSVLTLTRQDAVLSATAGGDGLSVKTVVMALSKGKYDLQQQYSSFRVRGVSLTINREQKPARVTNAMIEFALDTEMIQGLSAIIELTDPFTDKAVSKVSAKGKIGIVDLSLNLLYQADGYGRVEAIISSVIPLKKVISASAQEGLPEAVTELQLIKLNLTFDTKGNVDISGEAGLGETGITLLPNYVNISSLSGVARISFQKDTGVQGYALKGACKLNIKGAEISGDMEFEYSHADKSYSFTLHPFNGKVPVSLLYAAVTNMPTEEYEAKSGKALNSSGFTVGLPTGGLSSMRITEIYLKVQSDFKVILVASVKAALPGPVKSRFPFGIAANMTMGGLSLTFQKPFTKDYIVTIGGEAEWRVKNDITIAVSADLSSMKDGMGGRISGGFAKGDLGIGELGSCFGSKSGQTWTESVSAMKMGGVRIDAEWKLTPTYDVDWTAVRVTGTVNLGNLGAIQVEVITGTLEKEFVLALNVHLASPQAAAQLLAQTAPKVDNGYFASLPPMTADMTFSTKSIEPVAYPQFVPKEYIVTKAKMNAGIELWLGYTTPVNGCDGVSGKLLCVITTKCLGSGASVKLGGYVRTDTWTVGLKVSIANVRLSNALLLMQASIFVEVGTTSVGIGLEGNLQHTVSDGQILYYTGQIRADLINGVPTLQMTFTSRGMWNNIFGQKFLSLGDMYLSGGVSIVPPPVFFAPTSFGLGGKIQMGTACATQPTTACITASCYARIDLVDPIKGNFLQFQTTALTFSTIVDTLAGGGNTSKLLPKCMQSSGFPDGLFASFAGSAQTLPNGVIIKEGMNFNGTIDLLGYRVSAYIAFVPLKSLAVDIKFAPIIVAGGALAITESMTNWQNGPRFALSVDFGKITEAWYKQLASPPKLSAAAAVKVFGFQVSAAIEIGFDMFSVEVNGSLFGGWIVARVKVYATLDVFGLFANAKFEFLVTVQRQSEAEIAKQVETQYQSTAAGKVKTLEDSIAENEQAAKDLEAANVNSKQCYADCGNVQKCTAEFEQCKDPWNTMFYSESCRRTSSCASNERKSQVCKSRPWYAPWKCNSYADQCCSRTLTDSFPAYKASSCKKSYDFCIKPKSGFWDIVGAAFTGQIDVAWCSAKCKAADLVVEAKVAWLKTKALALKTLNAISQGAQKVWSAMKKYVGMIITVNNITAHGVLSTEGQTLEFNIDMVVIGIPIKAKFGVTPKTGREIDTKSIAEASYNQTAKVIESSTEEELSLLQLDLSGLETAESALRGLMDDAQEALCGAKLGLNATQSPKAIKRRLFGDENSLLSSCVDESGPADAAHVNASFDDVVNATVGEVGEIKKAEVSQATDRLVLVFKGTIANLTEEHVKTVKNVTASILGLDEFEVLLGISEFQKPKPQSGYGDTVQPPKYANGTIMSQEDAEKQGFTPPPVPEPEMITKVAMRIILLSNVSLDKFTMLANKLSWYSELEGPTILGKGALLDGFPLESAAVSSEPTPGEASASLSLKLTEAEANAKRAEIVGSLAAKLGVDPSRIVLDIKPSPTSLIQIQDGSVLPTPDAVAEISAITEISFIVTPDVRADALSSSDPNKEIEQIATEPLLKLSELVGAPVASVSATVQPESYTAPTKVFDDSKAYLSTAAWAGIVCGAVALVALAATITFFALRKRPPAADHYTEV